MKKDTEGKITYKIDTNNNQDFSDEKEEVPIPIIWEQIDSLSQYAHIISAETLIKGEVKEIEVPVLILISERGNILFNFPQYAKTHFLGNQINISSGFADINFRQNSSICIGDSIFGKTREIIEKDEFLNIGSSIFQNLGVNFINQNLQLKKMPTDTILYSTQVGFLAKPFEGKDFMSNETISLKNYSGKYLFLEFWGTWCGPCVEEIPNLKSVYNNIDKERISFLGIAEDRPESLKKFLVKQDLPWQQILSQNNNNLVDLYGIKEFPTSFLINENGKIVAKNLRGENLLDTLNHYLK